MAEVMWIEDQSAVVAVRRVGDDSVDGGTFAGSMVRMESEEGKEGGGEGCFSGGVEDLGLVKGRCWIEKS